MTAPIAQIDTHRTWGGGQYQVLALTRGLRDRGVPVVLFARADGELARRAQHEALPLVGLPPAFCSRWHPGGGHFLAQWCAERHVALLHAHDARALTLAQRAARRTRRPVILSRRVASPLRRNPLSRVKYSPSRLDGIVATSATVAAMVRAGGYPASRIVVVESGTDAAALAAKPPDADLRRWAAGRPLLGSAGKLVSKKNWAHLVRVAAALHARGHDLRWVIAGDGPDRDALRALADGLGLRDRLYLASGAADPERVVKSLDVMFHPARREGSAAILRVAMFSRVPIVASDAPALVEALEGAGLTLPPDDVGGATAAIAQVLSDVGLRERLVSAAERVAHRRYRIEAMVEGTLAAYEALAPRGAR